MKSVARSEKRLITKHTDYLNRLSDELVRKLKGDGGSVDVNLFNLYNQKWRMYARNVNRSGGDVELREDAFQTHFAYVAKEFKQRLGIRKGKTNRWKYRLGYLKFGLVVFSIIAVVVYLLKILIDLSSPPG
jgi:hypothetical protein